MVPLVFLLLSAMFTSCFAQIGDSCITPDKRQGECINIRQCQDLIDMLTETRPVPPEVVDYLRRSQCGFDGRLPLVCCPLRSSAPIPVPSPSPKPQDLQEEPLDASDHPNLRLLPLNICGPFLDDKIWNGKKTALYEYPWMALIGYTRAGSDRRVFRCGGTVINEKYILTAAHCLVNLPSTLRLAGVRLGEHDMSKDIDCMEDDNGEEFCADPPVDFDIEAAIAHPNYSPSTFTNDIGIIRIRGTANFRSDSIKPICLPLGIDQKRKLEGETLIVSGWGTTERGTGSEILLKVGVPVTTLEQCSAVYNRTTYRQPIRITNKQICAGGENAEDSCDGDSGGPLIFKGEVNTRTRFVQYGIVSFGPRSCGIKGYPAVYTRVSYYVDWILSNMKP